MESQNFISKTNETLHRITWKIEKFGLVARNPAWINLQSCEFETAVDGLGLETPLKWRLYLEKSEENDKYIEARMQLLNCPDSLKGTDRVFEQSALRYSGDREKGINTSTAQLSICDSKSPNITAWETFIDVDSCSKFLDEDGALQMTAFVKLIVLPLPETATSKVLDDLEIVLKNFQAEATTKARTALEKALLDSDIPCTEVKIVTKDGKEFVAQWGVLAARSPYFAKMYESNMIERETGIMEVQDISGKTMEVLRKFIYFGELLPAWKEDEVIVELTNAAAMYELTELLELLDRVLGQICNQTTAVQLLSLARKLSLKKAEKGVLEWIKKNVANSTEGFFSIMEQFAAGQQE